MLKIGLNVYGKYSFLKPPNFFANHKVCLCQWIMYLRQCIRAYALFNFLNCMDAMSEVRHGFHFETTPV